jgi:hypothetical protein
VDTVVSRPGPLLGPKHPFLRQLSMMALEGPKLQPHKGTHLHGRKLPHLRVGHFLVVSAHPVNS